MNRILLMVPISHHVGLTTVSIGLAHALESEGIQVNYLNPFDLGSNEIQHLLSEGKEDIIIEAITEKVEKSKLENGVFLVQGIILTQLLPCLAALNKTVAKVFDAEVIFVATPRGKSPQELKEEITIAAREYGGIKSIKTLGCMINKVGAPIDKYGNARIDLFDLPDVKEQRALFSKLFDQPEFKVLGCFPWKRSLMAPRLKDLVSYLNAEVVSPGNLDRGRVNHFSIAATTIEYLSTVLTPNMMIITPADRFDVIISICMAYLNGTKIAGILLTGDYPVSEKAIKLCDQALRAGLTVLKVKTDSLRTAISLQNLNIKIPKNDKERRQAVIEYVGSFIDRSSIKKLLSLKIERRLSPGVFKYQLMEKARKAGKKIVLPEGEEPRIIQAAQICAKKGIAFPVLLGNREKVQKIAQKHGITLNEKIECIDPFPLRKKYLPTLMEMRNDKGLSEQNAKEALEDNIVIGTMMLGEGEVDGLVAGAIHTTAHTIRPALMLIKTKLDVKKVSSIFFMCLPSQVLVYGDCAVNQNPTAQELAEIAIQCADSAERFGIYPRVAMISYSTGTSGTGADVAKVKEATELVKKQRPDVEIDGPLQYDAAFSADVASIKAPDSPVAGKATVYVFPDLNTANTTYKAVQRSANVLSIGPMLQGLKKPVNDLSRGALINDIVYTIAITAIQAI